MAKKLKITVTSVHNGSVKFTFINDYAALFKQCLLKLLPLGGENLILVGLFVIG